MPRRRFDRDGAEFGRGLGFFDAIYGFAITLLIVNVDLPPAEAWRSLSTLLHAGLGSHLLGFAISFIVIAVFWRNNTALLSRFRGLDGPVIAANLATAGLIVLVPFSTQGISDPETSAYPLATAWYAVNVASAMLSQAVMLEIGRARGLLVDDIPRSAYWASRVDVAAQIAVFLVSIPIAYLLGPVWAQVSWLLLIVVGRITGVWSERIVERDREGGQPPR
ncbi:DUF1211 domain-containing protein [Leucobacter weissii]|uniref:DUF1211 domain-containing protein n=1 Tax=Leucobacter weissii TaxID=1983706 RepID=A0A939MGS9_9MICO|nr:TMEM175 family protein [Leucobacter weissii]MBO1900428.1 DUF1211 domain-containing protein [Leucobacter weissii]